jgi:hypothetical protein
MHPVAIKRGGRRVPSYPGMRLHPEDVLALLGERVAAFLSPTRTSFE